MSPKIGPIRKSKIFLSLGLFLAGLALTAYSQEAGTAATESAKWKKPAFALKFGGFFPT